MQRLHPTRKILCLVLALTFLSVRLSTVSYAVFVVPCQQVLSQKPFLADGAIKPTAQVFKQKRLQIDASLLAYEEMPEGTILPAPTLYPTEVHPSPAEIYLPRFIPPS